MIHLVTTDSAAREAGVVYTRSWMVELVLDLAGYLPERRLGEMVAMEPSAGDGAFLSAMVRRLVKSCERHGIPLATAGRAIQAFEIDPVAAERAGRVVCETLRSLRDLGLDLTVYLQKNVTRSLKPSNPIAFFGRFLASRCFFK